MTQDLVSSQRLRLTSLSIAILAETEPPFPMPAEQPQKCGPEACPEEYSIYYCLQDELLQLAKARTHIYTYS